MQDFIEESLEIESTANAMVAKVNFVSDAAKKNERNKTVHHLHLKNLQAILI